jgi:hypothetical protein
VLCAGCVCAVDIGIRVCLKQPAGSVRSGHIWCKQLWCCTALCACLLVWRVADVLEATGRLRVQSCSCRIQRMWCFHRCHASSAVNQMHLAAVMHSAVWASATVYNTTAASRRWLHMFSSETSAAASSVRQLPTVCACISWWSSPVAAILTCRQSRARADALQGFQVSLRVQQCIRADERWRVQEKADRPHDHCVCGCGPA